MILFLLLTFVFWLATAGFTLMLWISIQPDNWLGAWQQQLRKWDMAGRDGLYRIGGGCQICFCHAIAQLAFWAYLVFMSSMDMWVHGILGSIIWYGLWICIATNLNLFFITKLFR